MNQTIEDLKAAREIIKDHWHQGALTDGCGNYCAVGAVNMAICGQPTMAASIAHCDRQSQALMALTAHMPKRFRVIGIPSFNDDITTTHADVMTLFDKALANPGGLA